MNQKCLTTIFVPVQPLNFNINPPSFCQEHQKPLSYYNKNKPDKDPICLDCLINEAKEGKDINLYLPFSNLEQEYYYQKNAFFQIIEQANNMKKYDAHITNFQRLLTNFFGQFVAKFLKEKIFGNSSNSNSTQKKVDFCDKNNTCLNSKEIMNILNKVENEKYILDNKCADVFSQINQLQRILLKNHDKLEKSFKDLLYGFFDIKNGQSTGKDNLKENQSNKRNISIPSNSSQKSQDILASTKYQSKTPIDDNISQFSPINDLKGHFSDKLLTANINLNMEKEKIFEENIEFEPDEEKKSVNSHNEINNSFPENKFPELFPEKVQEKTSPNIKDNHELEWRKKKCDEEPFGWRRKTDDDDNDEICREHKDKINKLIEQDKNKKSSTNQSFFQPKKNFNKKCNLNKSFQKYNPAKFCFSKKIDYKQYNQFMQKTCKNCGSSFVTTKDDETCQNCRYISDDEEKLKRKGHRDFSNKNEKFRFFPKNYGGSKKPHMQGRTGNKKFFLRKNETSFNRQFGNKTLIHSNSNFLSLNHLGNNRMNSPKGYDEHKKFNNNGRYNKLNKGKEKHEQNHGKNNFAQKKYQQKNNNDDFEVDLESDNENKSNDNNENDMSNNLSKIEKTFFKTSVQLFDDNSRKKIEDNNMNDNNDNDDSQSDIKKNMGDNKSNDSYYKKVLFEKEDNNDEEMNADNCNNVNKDGDDNGDDSDNNDGHEAHEHDDDNMDNDFEADF